VRARAKVIPFRLDPADFMTDGGDDAEDPSDGGPAYYPILGKLRRKDFELWIRRSDDGTLSLKWWRWQDDLERFSPLEDGELTLDPSELMPLAELLVSAGNLLRSRGHL
jgi:hypothetical protein